MLGGCGGQGEVGVALVWGAAAACLGVVKGNLGVLKFK